MVGVVSLVPFLTAIADLENIHNVGYLAWMYDFVGFANVKQFLIALAFLSFVMLILNNIVRFGSIWIGQKVSMRIWESSILRTYQFYLEQPYVFYLNRNSAEMTDKLMIRVNSLAAGLIRPFLLIISHALTGGLIVLLLFGQDFFLTLILMVLFAAFYLAIYHPMQRKMARYGTIVSSCSPEMIKLTLESFGGIKELKVLGRIQTFIDQYTWHTHRLASSSVKSHACLMIPGSLIEIMAIGSILVVGGYLLLTHSDMKSILPTLGMYLIASRRLQPAMAGIFFQMGQLRFYRPSFDIIWPDLVAAFSSNIPVVDRETHSKRRIEGESQSIDLSNVKFGYNTSSGRVIDNLSLKIPALTTIGIVGESGAGKTTLVDMILGLLEPDEGEIMINGFPLGEYDTAELCKHIGYVPQHVFLADDTIARNIAFGLADEDLDLHAVYRAAQLAQINVFIEEELPQQYQTLIGERGVRLSGGQRQRLGIARSLYHDPEILVLDEATSALDGITETEFSQAVRGLSRKKTIIIIAHRLTTLKDCDEIIILRNGQIADRGSFDSLLSTNPVFAEMANMKQ